MPINIKELIINSEIEDELSEDEFELNVDGDKAEINALDLESRFEDFKEEIIKECLEKFKEMISLSMEK